MELELSPAHNEAERAEAAVRAAEVLGAGGLVVHPTETVYGIGGDGSAANNALIGRAKRRERLQPLILLALDVATLRSFLPGLRWPRAAEPAVERFWPGPLTIVVPCADAPEALRGPGGGVAVRVTPDPTVRAILSVWRQPMTSTSANLAGAAPARTAADAVGLFRGREDLADIAAPVIVIDAGPSSGTRPSTIVSFVEAAPRLVREGPVRRAQLAPWIENLM